MQMAREPQKPFLALVSCSGAALENFVSACIINEPDRSSCDDKTPYLSGRPTSNFLPSTGLSLRQSIYEERVGAATTERGLVTSLLAGAQNSDRERKANAEEEEVEAEARVGGVDRR